MNQQDILREGIETILEYNRRLENVSFGEIAKQITKYLHSQGVVIKVDRELPNPEKWGYKKERPDGQVNMTYQVYKTAQNDMLGAGYVAVEPLVKE